MAKAKATAKAPTLRQRLRSAADKRLLEIGKEAYSGVVRAIENADAHIDPKDLMRFMSGTQVSTLQEKLITELANEAEDALEALYNKQMELPGTDDD